MILFCGHSKDSQSLEFVPYFT